MILYSGALHTHKSAFCCSQLRRSSICMSFIHQGKEIEVLGFGPLNEKKQGKGTKKKEKKFLILSEHGPWVSNHSDHTNWTISFPSEWKSVIYLLSMSHVNILWVGGVWENSSGKPLQAESSPLPLSASPPLFQNWQFKAFNSFKGL